MAKGKHGHRPPAPRHALQRGDGRRADRRAAARAVRVRRDEGAELAFAALVERHGPMVLRVCRGVLARPARRRGRLPGHVPGPGPQGAARSGCATRWGPGSTGSAYRTASCARAAAARRRRHERRAAAMCGPRDPPPRASTTSARCSTRRSTGCPSGTARRSCSADLEGLTHEQAARHWAGRSGRSKSRLARGRERLRQPARPAAALAGPEPGMVGQLSDGLRQGRGAGGVRRQSTVSGCGPFRGRGDVTAGAVPAPVARLAEGILR